MINIGELIEKLCISNAKLFQLCDKKALMAKNPGDFTKEEMAAVMAKDIALCEERAALKNAINKALGFAGNEIKSYGS